MELTKRLVKSRLGYETDAELARFFDIGRWAVGQWPEDKAIPKGRQWELIGREPELFGKSGKRASSNGKKAATRA